MAIATHDGSRKLTKAERIRLAHAERRAASQNGGSVKSNGNGGSSGSTSQ